MAIKKPEQLDFSNKPFCVVLSGSPGLGKTTLALSAPNPLLFDFDKGIARVRAEHRTAFAQYSDYAEFIADLESEEYKASTTIVIDAAGGMIELMKGTWAKKQDKRAATNGMAMFGVIKSEFARVTEKIRNDGKNLVIIFHTTEVTKGDTTVTRLSCEGSAKDIVWTPADLGAHMYMMGGNRMIGFSPTEEYFAKSCYGISGVHIIPSLKAGDKNDYLTRLFEEARANIKREMDDYAPKKLLYKTAMNEGMMYVDGVHDVESLNIARVAISNLTHELTSKEELGALLNAKAKELGCKYDKDVKAYVKADA